MLKTKITNHSFHQTKVDTRNMEWVDLIVDVLGRFGRFGASGTLGATTRVFFAYVGFDCVATVAQEAKKPTAISIPFAIIASVVISAVLYVGIATIMVGLASYKSLLSYSPLSEAMYVLVIDARQEKLRLIDLFIEKWRRMVSGYWFL